MKPDKALSGIISFVFERNYRFMSRFTRIDHSAETESAQKKAVIKIAGSAFTALALAAFIGGIAGDGQDASDTSAIEDRLSAYYYEEPEEIPEPQFFEVTLTADGKDYKLSYEEGSDATVADVLSGAGVTVDDDDLINVGLNEKINKNTDIVINRVEKQYEVSVETIDYKTNYKNDPNYVVGHSEVVVEGEEGSVEITELVTYIDGKETKSEVVSKAVTEPVDKVVLNGTCPAKPISQLKAPDSLVFDENGAPVSYSHIITGKSCAYSAKPGAKTASGRTAMVGYVAVDPAIIPYGTELYIATTDNSAVYGYAIAADTGTALLDGRIVVDLFMESYDASCEWGARQVNIYVLN